MGQELEWLKKDLEGSPSTENKNNIWTIILWTFIALTMLIFIIVITMLSLKIRKLSTKKNKTTIELKESRLTKSENDLIKNLSRIEDDPQSKGGGVTAQPCSHPSRRQSTKHDRYVDRASS